MGGGGHDESGHLSPDQVLHQRSLERRVARGLADQQAVPVLERGRHGAPDQLTAVVAGGDRVGDEADGAALLRAQAAGRQVGSVVELAGGAQDALPRLLGDPHVTSSEDE